MGQRHNFVEYGSGYAHHFAHSIASSFVESKAAKISIISAVLCCDTDSHGYRHRDCDLAYS